MNIQLSSYYKNFIDNEIYDINRLIEQMKSPINKFEYEDMYTNFSIFYVKIYKKIIFFWNILLYYMHA